MCKWLSSERYDGVYAHICNFGDCVFGVRVYRVDDDNINYIGFIHSKKEFSLDSFSARSFGEGLIYVAWSDSASSLHDTYNITYNEFFVDGEYRPVKEAVKIFTKRYIDRLYKCIMEIPYNSEMYIAENVFKKCKSVIVDELIKKSYLMIWWEITRRIDEYIRKIKARFSE